MTTAAEYRAWSRDANAAAQLLSDPTARHLVRQIAENYNRLALLADHEEDAARSEPAASKPETDGEGG